MYTTLHYGPADVADDGHGGGYDDGHDGHVDEDHTTLHGLHVSKLSKSCLRGREIPSHDRIWELRDFDLSDSIFFASVSLLSF